MRARKICARIGCSELQPCPTHERKAWAGSSRRERTISGSAQQKRARRIHLRDGRVCHVCSLPGADEVDHVIPLAEGGADEDPNLASIHSLPCHSEKSQAEAQRAARAVST